MEDGIRYLSLVAGTPTSMRTLKAVLNELIVEEYATFDMMEQYNQADFVLVKPLLTRQKGSEVSMRDFIQCGQNVKLYIRTGETMPASNILLVSASGVPCLRRSGCGLRRVTSLSNQLHVP